MQPLQYRKNRQDKKGDSTLAFILLFLVFLALFLGLKTSPAHAETTARIKDIVNFEGIRDNMLVGYGLVVGLNGTGDKLNNEPYTEQSLMTFLERLGINTKGQEQNIKPKNIASVMVTATLPPFSRNGSRINVNVSTLGDSTSLLGGHLLATPLLGADAQVYAVAQGGVAIEGYSAQGNTGSSITKGVPTNAFISNGAIVEREIDYKLNTLETVNLALKNPDIATASNISAAVNRKMGGHLAKVTDPGTVQVTVPPEYHAAVVEMLNVIEQIPVETDQVAKIIIDEASGTIVMGENVRIDTVAVAQGNLVVKIEETPLITQPGPFGFDENAPINTAVVPNSVVTVNENADKKMTIFKKNADLRDLVNGMNSLGVGPRDMISILQTMKAAGAIQAEITTR